MKHVRDIRTSKDGYRIAEVLVTQYVILDPDGRVLDYFNNEADAAVDWPHVVPADRKERARKAAGKSAEPVR
jgi:hypothetical protein